MDFLEPFRHRWVLFLLVLPMAMLVFVWARRGQVVALPVDHLQPAKRRWLAFLLRSVESLPAVLLAVIILILAGPQRFGEPKSKRVLTNIAFCVDVSGSMTASFEGGDRYEAAMTAINGFIEARKGDAFSLTFFGNNVLHWCPLTTDISAFRCAPPFMHPDKIPAWFGGTYIGKALLACREVLLEHNSGDRMIVLVSDGESADLDNGEDEIIARRFVRDGIVVHAVHVAEPPVPDEVTRITTLTGGQAFAPGDKEALASVFDQINKMQRTKLEKTRAESIDNLEPFVLVGLCTLLLFLFIHPVIRSTPW